LQNYVDEDLQQIEYENFQIENETTEEFLQLESNNEFYVLIRYNYDGEASTTLNQAPKLPTGGTQILSLFLSLILT